MHLSISTSDDDDPDASLFSYLLQVLSHVLSTCVGWMYQQLCLALVRYHCNELLLTTCQALLGPVYL